MYSLKEEKISQITPFSVLADNKRIRNKIIEGKSFQATRSGKNLFDKNKSGIQNGCAKTTLDTGVRVKMTYEGQYRYLGIELGGSELLGKEISIGAKITPSASNTGKVNLYYGNANNMAVSYARININGTGYQSITGTIANEFPDNCDRVYLLLYGNDAGTGNIDDYVDYTDLMVVLGNTLGEYEAYGAMPRPEFPSEIHSVGDEGTVEIKQTGKNLLDLKKKPYNEPSSTLNGAIVTIENGILTVDATNVSDKITLKSNWATYTSVTTIVLPKGTYYTNLKLNLTDSKTLNSKQISAGKFTIDTDHYLTQWFITPPLGVISSYALQIEQAEEQSEYEPYKENYYVIPLSQPLRSLPNGVKDTIEEDGIHRRVGNIVFDGSEDWFKGLSNGIIRFEIREIDDILQQSKRMQIYSNYFKYTSSGDYVGLAFAHGINNGSIFIYASQEITTVEMLKEWLAEQYANGTPVKVQYELAEEVIEPFDEEQQAVINSMETFEGVNHFSLVGDLETTLTFDYNPQITDDIKNAFKYNITKAYLQVSATEQDSGFQINEDNYLQSIDFDDCRYVPNEGIIGSCVAKEIQGKFVNVDSSFDIENRELECYMGAEVTGETTKNYFLTEDTEIDIGKIYYILNDDGTYSEVENPIVSEISNYYELNIVTEKTDHYLKLGTFIVQKPENDNVKDNTTFYALDYMVKFNATYVHRMAKYFKTEDTEIIQDKKYYTLSEGGEYIEVTVPKKDEISTYYEVIDEYTLMELLKDICDQSDVKLGTFNFRNADYVVHGNRFDSGVTCRDVLKAIAQAAFSWARINEYNELLLDFETSDTITEEIDYNEYYGLNFNDKYGPVNTIVMKNSQAEGENVPIKNDELINSAGGKNLFTGLVKGIGINSTTGAETTNDSGATSDYIPLDFNVNQNYYLNGLTSTLNSYVAAYNKNKEFLGRTGGNAREQILLNPSVFTGGTAQGTGDIAYLRVTQYYISTNTGTIDDVDELKVQLEVGSSSTQYEDFIPLGTKELAISDNPFAYSDETRKAIIQAGEAIYGFKYVPLSVETIGAAYLNCKDKIKIKNMQDEDLETYVFDTRISYQGTLKSNVETLAMTDTETKYKYDGSLTTAQRRTEFKVDKAEQEISSLTKLTTEQGKKLTKATQDLEGFERIIEDTTGKTNDRLFKIEEDINGLVTQKSVSGGQNLIKNSVGYFGNDFWQINSETEGTVLSENSTDVKQNSISGSALKLQAETIYQDINEIKNGEYYLSFNYKKIIDAAIATLKVNDLIINLNETDWKQEEHLINVTTNNIKIEMTTDLNSSILITDLMLTEGNLQVSWTQNANESYTDTVQIGKGVRITATGSDTEFVAEASGITINNTENGNKVAGFTKYGTETQELVAHKDVKVADSLLIQKIGNQTWFSSL